MPCQKTKNGENTNKSIQKQHRKMKTEQHEPHQRQGWSQVLWEGKYVYAIMGLISI